MVSRCPRCHELNPPKARMCRYCGVLLPASPRRPPPIHSTGKLAPDFLLKLQYRIIKQVGKGGFGAVYQAEDTYFHNRFVAIKEMSLSKLSRHENFEAHKIFHQEVQMLLKLTYPNLPRIYDNFPHDGRQYIVMQFIEGETLDQYLYETMSGLIPIQEVLDIGIQLCNVLVYLHTRQPPIIFRDLKPSNVMLTPDKNVFLIDFGIARHFKIRQARDTNQFGTTGYFAPELAYRQSNPRSDMYSLGVTLHELLTASDPMHNPIRSRSLRLHNRFIPTKLEKLIMQMLDRDPGKRPHNMAEVKQQLQSIQVQLSMRVKNSSRVSALFVEEGFVPGEIIRIYKKEMIMGRSNDCDIILKDILVSRSHATLQSSGNGQYTIRDNESSNGTFVNGQRLKRFQKYLLQDGDEIKLGDTLLIFREW